MTYFKVRYLFVYKNKIIGLLLLLFIYIFFWTLCIWFTVGASPEKSGGLRKKLEENVGKNNCPPHVPSFHFPITSFMFNRLCHALMVLALEFFFQSSFSIICRCMESLTPPNLNDLSWSMLTLSKVSLQSEKLNSKGTYSWEKKIFIIHKWIGREVSPSNPKDYWSFPSLSPPLPSYSPFLPFGSSKKPLHFAMRSISSSINPPSVTVENFL